MVLFVMPWSLLFLLSPYSIQLRLCIIEKGSGVAILVFVIEYLINTEKTNIFLL